MPQPPAIPVDEKVRIVLSILTGEMTVAQAARRARASEQSIGTWRRQFIENGRAGLVAKNSRTPSREAQLEAEIEELKTALGQAHVELRVWKKSAEHRLAPSKTSR
ncbi:helix-turn-helix domain-containing protein [Nonomuraea lactucae]|uniref:helix-turn-helix domain-containing protein n=1 Tax=Nonomuraea lactucae TaxID=2249762 RepID=UPI001964F95F|nr:helix-turn-helix domain-containing protein [Nonomuraea lactucae]